MFTKKTKHPKKMTHVFVSIMPPKNEMKEDTLYISLDYNSVLHKCACGCGEEISTPLTSKDWSITYNGESVSLYPSVGNWAYPCRSHYIIKNDHIIWAEDWSYEKVQRARKMEQAYRSKGNGEGKKDSFI